MIFNCNSKNSTYIIIVFTVSLPNQGEALSIIKTSYLFPFTLLRQKSPRTDLVKSEE